MMSRLARQHLQLCRGRRERSAVWEGVRCRGGVQWGAWEEGRESYLFQAAHFADGKAEAWSGGCKVQGHVS